MAGDNNGWNSFMQSKQTQLVLYGICVICCLFYAVGGVVELMHPEAAAQTIEAMGATAYYAMTIIRTIVLLITGIAFGRVVYKRYKDED